MTTDSIQYIPAPPADVVEPRETYLNISYKIRSWLLTRDHKRIGLLYLASITFFFFVGGAAATLMRLELLTPAIRPRAVRAPTTASSRSTAS